MRTVEGFHLIESANGAAGVRSGSNECGANCGSIMTNCWRGGGTAGGAHRLVLGDNHHQRGVR